MKKWMRKSLGLAGLIFCLAVLSGFSTKNAKIIRDNNYYNKTVCFSITKPKGWHFLTLDEVFKSQGYPFKNVSPQEREQINNYYKSLEQETGLEPITIARFPEPYDGDNPGFQVSLEPMGPRHMSSQALAEETIAYYTQRATNFELLIGPNPERISGLDATNFKFSFTVFFDNGKTSKGVIEAWIITLDNKFYMISSSRPVEDKEKKNLDKQFKKILKSISINQCF